VNVAEQDSYPGDSLDFLDARGPRFPLAVRAFRSLFKIQPLFESNVTAARWQDDDFWCDAEDRCREILHLCDQNERKFEAAVAEWVTFSLEFVKKQRKFRLTGRYGSESFEKVQHELYDNAEKMQNFYLIALMFSFVFSSNYSGMFAFFRSRMIPRLRETGSVCDVGCGHGVYLSQMLLAEPASMGVGVDISLGSLETSRRMLTFHGIDAARFRLLKGDVQAGIPIDSASQDGITCFEVIEHLERPSAAIAEFRRVLKPGGTLSMSTAIRMESVDHIHLFRSPDEVRRLVESQGFTIIEDDTIPLSTENTTDPEVRNRLIKDPKTALAIVLLLA
jgi:2-polyprenyl-3-methyl-5-hydroxy-6-metoxy-1,4-benzoquinol methylase